MGRDREDLRKALRVSAFNPVSSDPGCRQRRERREMTCPRCVQPPWLRTIPAWGVSLAISSQVAEASPSLNTCKTATRKLVSFLNSISRQQSLSNLELNFCVCMEYKVYFRRDPFLYCFFVCACGELGFQIPGNFYFFN